MKKLLITCAILFFPLIAMAGGSWEKVKIKIFTQVSSTDYELVVIPEKTDNEYKDPYMGHCTEFTVKGGYSWLRSRRFPKDVNRVSHEAALAYIKEAQRIDKIILFGWMGTGFVPIDPANKCVVRSRALQLWRDNETTAVVSYHNPV